MLETREIERWERLTEAMIRHTYQDTGRSEVGAPDPEAFAQVVRVLEYAQRLLPYAANQLRTEGGYSWTDIGNALGITRQSAQQRFGKA